MARGTKKMDQRIDPTRLPARYHTLGCPPGQLKGRPDRAGDMDLVRDPLPARPEQSIVQTSIGLGMSWGSSASKEAP